MAEASRLRNSLVVADDAASWKAATRLSEGDMPLAEKFTPKKLMLFMSNSHFMRFAVNPSAAALVPGLSHISLYRLRCVLKTVKCLLLGSMSICL